MLYVGKAKSLRSASPRTPAPTAQPGAADGRPGAARRVGGDGAWRAPSSRRCCWSRTSSRRTGRTFNVRLRDDKSYPYIAVTLRDRFPRVMFTRERHRRGVRYFGPYASASKVRETLDTLNRVFPFRPCEGPEPGPSLGRAVPRLPHRTLRGALRRPRDRGAVRAADRPGRGVPRGPHRARPPPAPAGDARRGGRPALRGRGAGAQPAGRRGDAGGAAARRQAGHRRRRRARRGAGGRPGGGAALPAARRAARGAVLVHAGERVGGDARRPRRGVRRRALRQRGRVGAAADRARRRARRARGARGAADRSGAARGSRSGGRSAARSGGWSSSRSATPS